MSWECVSYWIEHHSGLASWVQAIGSIAAILAAFNIGNQQIKSQNKQRAREQEYKTEAYYAVVMNAVKKIESFGALIERNTSPEDIQLNWNMLYSQIFSACQNSLRALPAHELGSYNMVDGFFNVSGVVNSIISVADRYVPSCNSDPEALVKLRYDILHQCKVCELSMNTFNHPQ
jgi:hypothetical protein